MSCACPCPYPRPPAPVPARQQCRKKEPVCAAFVRLINDNAWKCVKAGAWAETGGKGKCHQRKKEGKGGRNCAIVSHQAAPPAALQFFMQFTDRAIDVFFSLLPSPSPSCCCFLLGVFFFKFSQRFQFRFLFFSFLFIFSRRFCNPAKNGAQARRVPRCGSTLFFFRCRFLCLLR